MNDKTLIKGIDWGTLENNVSTVLDRNGSISIEDFIVLLINNSI